MNSPDHEGIEMGFECNEELLERMYSRACEIGVSLSEYMRGVVQNDLVVGGEESAGHEVV